MYCLFDKRHFYPTPPPIFQWFLGLLKLPFGTFDFLSLHIWFAVECMSRYRPYLLIEKLTTSETLSIPDKKKGRRSCAIPLTTGSTHFWATGHSFCAKHCCKNYKLNQLVSQVYGMLIEL